LKVSEVLFPQMFCSRGRRVWFDFGQGSPKWRMKGPVFRVIPYNHSRSQYYRKRGGKSIRPFPCEGERSAGGGMEGKCR